MSQKVPSGAQLSRAPRRWEVARAAHTGHAEACRAGILMILMPGVDAGAEGVYVCLVPDPKWKFRLKACAPGGFQVKKLMIAVLGMSLALGGTLAYLAAQEKPKEEPKSEEKKKKGKKVKKDSEQKGVGGASAQSSTQTQM